MERSRPKIKLKSAAKTKETESVQSDRSQEPLTGASGGPVASVGHGDGLFPLVNEGIKRKRAPRAGERRTKQKHLLAFSTGSDVPSVQAEEGGFSGEEDDEDREEVEEESRMRDGRLFMTGNKSEMVEVVEVKSTQPVQQRQGRLKVRVKTSKLQEGSPAHLERLKGSDNSISSSLSVDNALEIQNTAAGVLRELQKSAASKSEMQANKPGRSIEKSSDLTMEPARSLDRPSTPRQTKSNRPDEMSNSPHQIQTEKSFWSSENQETKALGMPEGPRQKHGRQSLAVEKGQHDRSQYNEKELSDALMVVKKIMKMEAAEPFNTPVNPVALGIPDYFDVIDNPMDLGTICSALERGEKYMNSRDVFKDVQFIWENCCKYNSKGDPILDLMKRVKKNFAKYWTAAGLYYEPQKRTTGIQLSGQGDVVSNHEYGRLEESEMEHEGHNNADRNLEDLQMMAFADPCNISPQSKDKPDEQPESKGREQNSYQEIIESSKAQHHIKESETYVDIAKVCQEDAVVENNGRTLMSKKSKDRYEPQDKTVISDEKVDCVSIGTDEESGPKASDSTRSFQEETQQKETQSKTKTRRRHGKYNHKDGCLCAVCIARRRRHERETNARLAKNQSTMADADLLGKTKKEASELLEKPFSDKGVTKLDYSVEMNVIFQPDEQGDEPKVEVQEQEEGEIQEQEEEEAHNQKGRFTNWMHQQEENELLVQEEEEVQLQKKKESRMQEEEEAHQQDEKASLTQLKDEKQQKQLKELQMQQEYEGQHQQVKEGHGQEEEETHQQEGEIQEEGECGRHCPTDYEIPLQFASPSIMQMCEALFASNHYSAWNRAHSLSYKPSVTFSENPILATISTFME